MRAASVHKSRKGWAEWFRELGERLIKENLFLLEENPLSPLIKDVLSCSRFGCPRLCLLTNSAGVLEESRVEP